MGAPLALTVRLEIAPGGVELIAFNHGDEVARGVGLTVQEAIPRLVSFFKDMQEATIDALYTSGIITLPGVEPPEDKGLSS